MRAGIITIGNEILKGKTLNTNAAEIGRILSFSGYEVYRGIIVPDLGDEIGWAFRSMIGVCSVIVSSGGLGPTFDDITIASFAREFGLPLVRDEETYETIRKRSEERGLDMTPEREKMAIVPQGSKIIKNTVGSAPGIDITLQGSRIFILPGVPMEMRSMMDTIRKEIMLGDSFYNEQSVIVEGLYEASLAPFIKELMDKYDGRIYIKSHPSLSEDNISILEIEVSARAGSMKDAKDLVNSALEEIRHIVSRMKS